VADFVSDAELAEAERLHIRVNGPDFSVAEQVALSALARALLPRLIAEVRALRGDRDLLDGAADIRIVDGIGGIDIDEATAEVVGSDSEDDWLLEWRRQFRIALRAALDAARKEPTCPK
jgi:hypothetical protein